MRRSVSQTAAHDVRLARTRLVQAVIPLAGLVGGLVLLVLGLFLILGVRPPMNRSQSGVHVEREPLPTG